MPHDTPYGFILTLVNTLAGNEVNTESVMNSLELICKGFSFDCGIIYDTDFFGQFCLKERYTSCNKKLQEKFAENDLSFIECEFSPQKSFLYVEKGTKMTSAEKRLLCFFNAEALVLAPVMDESNSIYGYVVLLRTTHAPSFSVVDIDSLSAIITLLVRYVGVRMYRQKLKQAQSTLENILDNTGIDIYVNDFYTHEVLYVNKSMAAPYGGSEFFIGRKCWQVLFPGQTGPCDFCPQKKLIDEQGNPTKVYSWDYQRPFDGSWFRVFSAAFQWGGGRLAHVVSSADITENKQNEALIENLANYDQLTKLPNRRMLVKECERRIDKSTSTEQGYVLFFDIDGFKSINDSMSHDAGDEFLIQLGEFFSSIPLLKDAIYRNGGDEFVAIVGGKGITKENIKNLVNFIHMRFEKPWILKKGQIKCSTSVGVACYPEDGTTAEVLLQKADLAMYQVKKSGGAGLCFGYQLQKQE